jgi:hypothetical protein
VEPTANLGIFFCTDSGLLRLLLLLLVLLLRESLMGESDLLDDFDLDTLVPTMLLYHNSDTIILQLPRSWLCLGSAA